MARLCSRRTCEVLRGLYSAREGLAEVKLHVDLGTKVHMTRAMLHRHDKAEKRTSSADCTANRFRKSVYFDANHLPLQDICNCLCSDEAFKLSRLFCIELTLSKG